MIHAHMHHPHACYEEWLSITCVIKLIVYGTPSETELPHMSIWCTQVWCMTRWYDSCILHFVIWPPYALAISGSWPLQAYRGWPDGTPKMFWDMRHHRCPWVKFPKPSRSEDAPTSRSSRYVWAHEGCILIGRVSHYIVLSWEGVWPCSPEEIGND
jgi:hypothetical protein